jgi:hypothetical protein
MDRRGDALWLAARDDEYVPKELDVRTAVTGRLLRNGG